VLVDGVTDYSNVTLEGEVTFEAGDPGDYDIEIVYLTTVTDEQRAVFDEAAGVWEAAISQDLVGVDFGINSLPANSCGQGQREVVDVVDDLRIFMRVEEIDGEFGVLASAGVCAIRSEEGGNLPAAGGMRFDVADFDRQRQNGTLLPTVVHEIGHVLGIGTLWDLFELLENPSSDEEELDTHFTGPRAIQAFDDAGGADFQGAKVPVANVGGPGSINSHWREAVLRTELLTPQINAGSNPLSAISIESLADLGYPVDVSAADEYTLPGTSGGSAAMTEGPQERLVYDILRMPIRVVAPDGRTLRIIRR